MALDNDRWNVYVPDSVAPLRFSKSLTAEEVKHSLVQSGRSSVEGTTMEVSVDGNTITFKRPTGGNKGR